MGLHLLNHEFTVLSYVVMRNLSRNTKFFYQLISLIGSETLVLLLYTVRWVRVLEGGESWCKEGQKRQLTIGG